MTAPKHPADMTLDEVRAYAQAVDNNELQEAGKDVLNALLDIDETGPQWQRQRDLLMRFRILRAEFWRRERWRTTESQG